MGGLSLRRLSVFVLGAALGAALLLGCAFAGILGFTSVEGAVLSALLLLALVAVDVAIGGLLARVLLRGGGSSRGAVRGETRSVGLFVGGAIFVGALVSGLFLGAMILLDTAPSQRSLFAFAAGPGLGLVYGMVLGVPAVVGATIVELRSRPRRGDGRPDGAPR